MLLGMSLMHKVSHCEIVKESILDLDLVAQQALDSACREGITRGCGNAPLLLL